MDVKEKIESIVKFLDSILNDRSVPRNIKEGVEKAKNELLNENKDLAVRIDAAIQMLEEVSDDPNIPIYTRTQIWNIITLLESIEGELE